MITRRPHLIRRYLVRPRPNRALRWFFFLGLAGWSQAIAAEPAAAAPASVGGLRAPVVLRSVAPVHPPELRQQLTNGDAEVECLVGVDGKIHEAKVSSATHPEFGEAALEAIRQWEFKAGESEGKPVPMRVKIPIAFRMSRETIIETLARRPVFVEVNETVVPAEQLPKWPLPKRFHQPGYPTELRGSGKRGKAVVAVVIDKAGRVINPKIVKATHPEFILPSMMAATVLEFPPQTMADKQAICVSMEIQYDFTGEARTPAESKPKKGRAGTGGEEKPAKK